MYPDKTQALEAVERLRQRYVPDETQAREIVARFGGYAGWADLEARIDGDAGVPPLPTGMGRSLSDHLADNPGTLVRNGMWVIPDFSIERLLSPEEMTAAPAELTARVRKAFDRHIAACEDHAPWAEIDSVLVDAQGVVNLRLVLPHRDEIRKRHQRITLPAADDPEFESDLDAILDDYVAGWAGDRRTLRDHSDVVAGLADDAYGIDLVTARWARGRWGDAAVERIRRRIVEQYGDRDGDVDDSTSKRTTIRTEHDGIGDEYEVHVIDGVVRRAMRLDKRLVWDRAIHVEGDLPHGIVSGLKGRPVSALVEHELLDGLTVREVYELDGSVVVDVDPPLIRLDSIVGNEADWIRHDPVEHILEEEADLDWLKDEHGIDAIDAAFVNGATYALYDHRGRKRIAVVTSSGKRMSEEAGPFANQCPRRLIDAADRPETSGAAWRVGALGLTDRRGYSIDEVYF